MRRFLIVLITALTAFTLTVALPSAAQAMVAKSDPDDAPYQYNTTTVRLYPKHNGWVVVQMYNNQQYRVGGKFNGLELYLDTRGTKSPDYRLSWSFSGDGDGYTRNSFSSYGRTVSCGAITGKFRDKSRLIEIHIPRNCMRIGKAVGVRTETWDYTNYRNGKPTSGYKDRAPNTGFLR